MYYSPGQHVSWDEKAIWPTTLFSDSECFFVQLLSWPLAGQPMQCASILHVISSIIKLYNVFIMYNIL